MATTVNASLPMERQMLAAAIVSAADHLRALHCSTHSEMQKAWRRAAAGQWLMVVGHGLEDIQLVRIITTRVHA